MTRLHLRLLTYLSPSIPFAFYERLGEHVALRLGCRVSVTADETASGPVRAARDPFSSGRADVGFLCTPALLWLGDAVDLLDAAPLFADPRAMGRPVYFSDVVVRRDHPAQSFYDLRDARWAYNDPCSLSGYYNLLRKLHELPWPDRFLGEIRRSGSHRASLAQVRSGAIDASAIDSNVLAAEQHRDPSLEGQVRILESWGPYPMQPVVVRKALPVATRRALTDALLGIGRDAASRAVFLPFGVAGFSVVSASDYAAELAVLSACEGIAASIALEASIKAG